MAGKTPRVVPEACQNFHMGKHRANRALSGDELLALLETAVDQGMLSEEGADDVLLADVMVRGRRRDDRSEAYLVVAVSWGVGTGDVERAVRRASLLAQTGVQNPTRSRRRADYRRSGRIGAGHACLASA